MASSTFLARHSGAAAEKLAELHRSLTGGTNGTSPSANVELLKDNPLGLAELLFRRAPDDFLSRSHVGTLSYLSHQLNTFYFDFLESNKEYKVVELDLSSRNEGKYVTSFMLALYDRPFIVDTLTEFFREQGLRVFTYLHPILTGPGDKVISLNYIELEKIESLDRVQELYDSISSIMADLALVTSGFQPMIDRARSCALSVEEGYSDSKTVVQARETADVLHWLTDGGFVFLGHRVWQPGSGPASEGFDYDPSLDLGLFCSTTNAYREGLQFTSRDAEFLFNRDTFLHFSKLLLKSPVHRRIRMDAVCVKVPTETGDAIHCFVGLLTSKAIAQEASSIPFIRRKLKQIIELEGVYPNSHDYKETLSIIDSMPKFELFQGATSALRRDVQIILSSYQAHETRVSTHLDALRRIVSVMVVMPRERFTVGVRQRIQNFVEKTLRVPQGESEYSLAVADDPLVRLHFFVPNHTGKELSVDAREFEQRISELTLTWDDNLFRSLVENGQEHAARKLTAFYSRALPEQYKAGTSADEAAYDIQMLESLNETENLQIAVRSAADDLSGVHVNLRIYKKGGGLTLSSIVPFLENTELVIVDEQSTEITTQESVWAAIYNFRVRKNSGQKFPIDDAQNFFVPGLRDVINGKADNDRLNALLLDAGLAVSDLAILRTAQRYLWQIKVFTSTKSIVLGIARNPSIAAIIVEYFRTKFEPGIFDGPSPERLAKLEEIEQRFVLRLKEVSNLLDDRVLRAMLGVFKATVRTNYYHGSNIPIGLKIECRKIAAMPSPRPMFETFVNSPDFEGVHLRGGKVARGGLRWSERKDDYRTEILGLMKTQMVKNSIIIPVGAKGGFIVRGEATRESVENCYRKFIRTLLQLADNRVSDEIVHPPNTVIYDPDDPYLVVAADKGTATFSDIANSISIDEFDFWLGDAFASGGSNGYDHKKLGITARGAWEATCRHFREVGIDVAEQEFKVVGIGDMSGDVFGNGLLCSDKAKLIAAFNHRHIFIDPNPDAELSFKERKRMFETPGTQWTDYDASVLSTGGGIYNRGDKEIELSEEAARALGIKERLLSGQELVKAILCSPADLLWNGGIGTYVKSSTESNMEVEDPANDDVRVDARELRVKVVGEGGNLGFTQRARIEYSKLGGHINTDAVDNSGGVDCSDAEVNLKILLNEEVRLGKITLEERNELLEMCADSVCRKVIGRNRSQSMILSLGVRRSRKNIDYYRGLIAQLENNGVLDREGEFLPDDESLVKRSQLRAGLTRPELAVIIAYVKIALFEVIMKSSLPEEPFVERYLLSYFPAKVVQRFRAETEKHPLRREIVATQIANELVERMGASFVYRLTQETGAPEIDIICAFLAADTLLSADALKIELRVMDKASTTNSHLKALLTMTAALDGMTRWLLEHRNPNWSWGELIERYQEPFTLLLRETEGLVTEVELRRFQESVKRLTLNGFPENLAKSVASIAYATSYLDIAQIAFGLEKKVTNVAKLYARLAAEFQTTNLLEQAADIEPNDRWEALAVRAISAELKNSIATITRSVIEEVGEPTIEAMETYLSRRTEVAQRFRQSMREFHNKSMSIPAILVLTNQLRALSKLYV
ncbi:MAG: NAD-glutamate dehydrogenase [Bdellovibrionales bacterium]|nr:NAD-glutamate dehydrogenase [Bdellovibrionales bacterium]